ncbi:MAG: 4-alpha-glucanotransferase [Clostridiales Family XIII bacterium]|jgi:4-alpha-glucanotransferase|nr:4-alpha-glucanotransferase [Clostridiales Family XIII bacterium]
MRRAGILLPIFCLPSPYGIGSLGRDAFAFVDFLRASGQSLWQILPIGPTGAYDSPYQSLSAFAGNPYFIDLDTLKQKGLLRAKELDRDWSRDPRRVDYEGQRQYRMPLLLKAAERFDAKADAGYATFLRDNDRWLDGFADFMRRRRRSPDADPELWKRVQFFFFDQWMSLKRYANAKGIGIVGDLPYYVSEESSDYEDNPTLFETVRSGPKQGRPAALAGVPPDGFSRDGQVWNNPVYAWTAHRKDRYRWWIDRLKQAAVLYDACRIDHFRGFSEYYSIPVGEPASAGRWVKGPGAHFIDAVRDAVPGLCVIAEDLGILTEDVHALRRRSGYPGMLVLQFAFTPGEDSAYLPHNHIRNSVVYTGTHDNNTLKGWIRDSDANVIEYAYRYLGLSGTGNLSKAMIRAAIAGVAETAVIPMQDWLGLGAEARINAPSTVGGDNWRWRLRREQLTEKLSVEIFDRTDLYGRARKPSCDA